MKTYVDRGRSEKEFNVVDLVYLKLQPCRQVSVARRINQKISPKFYGHYKILQKIGSVAYRLKLPKGSSIHPVFYVTI